MRYLVIGMLSDSIKARIAEKELLKLAQEKAAAAKEQSRVQTEKDAEKLAEAANAVRDKAIAAVIEEIV